MPSNRLRTVELVSVRPPFTFKVDILTVEGNDIPKPGGG